MIKQTRGMWERSAICYRSVSISRFVAQDGISKDKISQMVAKLSITYFLLNTNIISKGLYGCLDVTHLTFLRL